MKRITALLIAVLMLAVFAACGTDSDKTPSDTSSGGVSDTSSQPPASSDESSADESQAPGGTLEGSLEDILAAIYASLDEEYASAVEYMVTTEIDPGNCGYYFGVETLDFKEGIASEADRKSVV